MEVVEGGGVFEREQVGAGQGGIFPCVFRESVATPIDAEATLEAAEAVLGYSGTAVTHKHCEAKAEAAPDMSASLDQFGRDRNEKVM